MIIRGTTLNGVTVTDGSLYNGGNMLLYLDAANSTSYPKSGTTWYDLSGNANTGTLTNGPTYNSNNLGNIVFDGTDDNIQLGNASTFLPTSAITLSCWAKTNTTTSYKKLFVTIKDYLFDRIFDK